MPYTLKPANGGFFVMNEETGAVYSNNPLTLQKAKAQMRALYASEKPQKPMKEISSKPKKPVKKLYTSEVKKKEDAMLKRLAKQLKK